MSATNVNRIKKDILALINMKYNVEFTDNTNEIHVKFNGPPDTPYENGIWKVRVLFTNQYPFKSPSISFVNKIFHPNIEEKSGVICLDVINQTWSPIFDLCNIFEMFLPQLLTYPNPSDPINNVAAMLYINHRDQYKKYVLRCVKKYASGVSPMDVDKSESSSASESSLSDFEPDDKN